MQVDQEMEFLRLNASFDWDAIERLTLDSHGGQGSADGSPKLKHCYAVSELAERLAREHFEDMDLSSQLYWTRVCKTAGLLHETMERGCLFEEIVAASDEAVAKVVGGCTRDVTLPGPRRVEMYANQVGLADAATQLVKLCDLRHEAVVRLSVMEARPTEEDAEKTSAWLLEARFVFPTLNKVESLVTAPQASRLRSDLDRLESLISRFEKKRKAKVVKRGR